MIITFFITMQSSVLQVLLRADFPPFPPLLLQDASEGPVGRSRSGSWNIATEDKSDVTRAMLLSIQSISLLLMVIFFHLSSFSSPFPP